MGGIEPPPIVGHLSGGEPIVKPTQMDKVGFYFMVRGGGAHKNIKGW